MFFFLVSSAIGVVTFFIWTIIIIVYAKNWKQFNDGFFKISIADYIFNFVTYLNSFISHRLPLNTTLNSPLATYFLIYSIDTEPNFFLNFSYFLTFSMAYVQYSMLLLTALNRFTVLYFHNYEQDTEKQFWFLIIFQIGTIIIAAILNLLSIVKFHKMPIGVRKTQTQLIIVSLASFFCEIVALVATIWISSDPDRVIGLSQTGQQLLPIASDLLTLTQPWILLVVSSKVRHFFKIMIRMKKKNKVPRPVIS